MNIPPSQIPVRWQLFIITIYMTVKMTQGWLARLTLIVCLILAIISGYGQSTDGFFKQIALESESFLKEKMTAEKIVGLSVAVIMNDSLIYKQGFGFSDKENKTPMTTSTVVNIGSITKTFTALSVMQLHEQGLLNINAPLVKYLPQFRPKVGKVNLQALTIKSVITHTSGIQPDVWKNSDLNSGKYTDVVGYINDTYLAYPPGMAGLYSNAGYNILGHLIKEVSKQDYAGYIHQFIFNPLGMTRSGFAMDSLKNKTKLYLGGNVVEEYELRDIASGGIYTNIDDFIKYAQALIDAYHGKQSPIIATATFKEMCKLQNADVPLETNKKGLGWFMFKNDSAFALYHAGSAGFAQAKLLIVPQRKAAIIVITNTAEGGGAAEEFCFNFLNKFGLSIPDLFPPPITGKMNDVKKPVKLSATMFKNHVGNYGQPYSYISVKLKKNTLKLIEGKQQYILKPLNKNSFLAFELFENDSMVESSKRYVFKDLDNYHILFVRLGNREYQLGSKLDKINRVTWSKRLGIYTHFGYQMIIGDTRFKEVEIYISEEDVLMLKLTTFGSVRTIPLRVISKDYAITSGISEGFGGYNIRFLEEKGDQIVDFAGIRFRKHKAK